ncbi:transposable element Tcb1 transposase [Trichonephila clavipes]|nr:transposable element Tcb1 transposase [Trichonephila clavipes]
MTWFYSTAVQVPCAWPHSIRRCRWVGVKDSTRNRRRDPKCPSARRLHMAREDTGAPNEGATCAWMAADEAVGSRHIQLPLWQAYSPDRSPIEHVWDLFGRRLARDSFPAASKDELLLRIQAIWTSLQLADIQNLFDSMPRRVAALIATHGSNTKYRFRTLNIVILL